MVSPQQIGHRIRDAREVLGMTQAELAAQVGVHKNQVSEWENGRVQRIKRPHRQILSDVLRVPLWELSPGGAGRPTPPDKPLTSVPASLAPLAAQLDEVLGEVRGLRTDLGAAQDVMRTVSSRLSAAQDEIRTVSSRLSALEPDGLPPARRQ